MKSHVVSVVVIIISLFFFLFLIINWTVYNGGFRSEGLLLVVFWGGFPSPPPPHVFGLVWGALVFGSFCSTTLPPPVNKICFGEETPPPRSLLTQVTPSRITSSNES